MSHTSDGTFISRYALDRRRLQTGGDVTMWSSPHRDVLLRHRSGNGYGALQQLTTAGVRNGNCGNGLMMRNSTDNCASFADEYFSECRGRVMTSDTSMMTSRLRADGYCRNQRCTSVKSAISSFDLSSAKPMQSYDDRNGAYFRRDAKTSVVNCSRCSDDDDDDDCSNDCDSNANDWMYMTEWRLVNGRYTSLRKLEQCNCVAPRYNNQDVKRPPTSNADPYRGTYDDWKASSSSLTSSWNLHSTAAVARHRNAVVGYSSCSSSPSTAVVNGYRQRTAALQRHLSTTLQNGVPRSAATAGGAPDVRTSNCNGSRTARAVQVDRQNGGSSCTRTASNGGYSRRRDCPRSGPHTTTTTVGRGSRAPSEPSRKRTSSVHRDGQTDAAPRTGNDNRHRTSDWQVANGKNCNAADERPTRKYRAPDDVRAVFMRSADGASSRNLSIDGTVVCNSNGSSCRRRSTISAQEERLTVGAASEVCTESNENDCATTRDNCGATKRSRRGLRSSATADPLFTGKSANEQRVIEELLRIDRTVEDELMELDIADDDDDVLEEENGAHTVGNSCGMNCQVVGSAMSRHRFLSESREDARLTSDYSVKRNELLEYCRPLTKTPCCVTAADVTVDAKQKDINSNEKLYGQQNQYDRFGDSMATGNNNNNDIYLQCSSGCEYGSCRAKNDDDKIAERREACPDECTRRKLSDDKTDARDDDNNGGTKQQTAKDSSFAGSRNEDCVADKFSSPFEERRKDISSCHLDVTSSSSTLLPTAGEQRDKAGCREAIVNQYPPSRNDEDPQTVQSLHRTTVEQEVVAPLAMFPDATKSSSATATTTTMTLRERFQRIVRLVVSSQNDDVFVEPSTASPKLVERRKLGQHGCLQAVAVLDRSSGIVETKLIGRKFCGRWSTARRGHCSAAKTTNNVSPGQKKKTTNMIEF